MAKRKQTTMEPVCTWCGDDLSEDVAYKSLTWFRGMAGVRMKLCSPTCRDSWDEANVSAIADTDRDSE